MRRLLVGAAVLALCAIGGPAAGIAASPSPSASPPSKPGSGSAVLPTSDAIDQQLAQALAEQQQLEASKSALAQEISAAHDAATQLQQLLLANQQQIAATMQQIDLEQRNLEDATVRATAAHARADDARARAQTDRLQLASILRADYEQPGGYVAFILAGQDIQTMMERVAQVRSITSTTSDLVAHLRAEQAEAESAEAEAAADEQRARQAAAALQAQRDTLTQESAHEQDLIGQLGAQASAATRELHAIDTQGAAVAQQVAALRIEQLDRIISDAEQAAWDQAQYYLQHSLTGLPEDAIPSADPASQPGGGPPAVALAGLGGPTSESAPNGQGSKPLLWPAPGAVVSQRFGPVDYPFEPPAFGFAHFHTGIDMAAPTGTHIYAAAAGIVVAAA
jgi:murein DD-endopeptidase MepM/ murein hydrolase activator NlpD